jgi:diguanylate cyclase (GGDEF)-like protein
MPRGTLADPRANARPVLTPPTNDRTRTAGNALHRHSGRSFWHVLSTGCLAALATHAMFALLFHALSVTPMVWVNLGSVALYGGSWLLLRARRNALAIGLIWAEILFHAVLAVQLIGWDSGFHYYLIVMLPLIFVSPSWRARAKLLLGCALLACYLGLDALSHRLPPVHEVGPQVLAMLRRFNIAATFLIIGFLAHVYHRAVAEAEQRLRAMASTDPLTGALNRRAMTETIGRSPAGPLSLLLADIDHFKRINDGFGHEAGDRVLVQVARAIRASVRPGDQVARWGGEEFLVAIAGDALQAGAVAERVRHAVEQLRLQDAGRPIPVTLTIGCATWRGAGESAEQCVARADARLYEGKQGGRNRVVPASGAAMAERAAGAGMPDSPPAGP